MSLFQVFIDKKIKQNTILLTSILLILSRLKLFIYSHHFYEYFYF